MLDDMDRIIYICTMKKIRNFICLVLVFLAGIAYGQDSYRSAGNHHTYIVPEFKATKAPAGYKPFYVSHYGRHGSRYHIGTSAYARVLPQLDSLHERGLLTAGGEDMRGIVKWMMGAQEGTEGILTQVGSLEHQGIGRRLYEHYPAIFKQKDRQVVVCIASSVQRCIQSMANFCLPLNSEAPDLDIRMFTGQKYYSLLAHPFDRTEFYRTIDAVTDSLVHELIDPEITGKKFFTDVRLASDVIKGQDIPTLIYNIFALSNIAKCFESDAPDPLKYFSDGELEVLGRIFNVESCCLYANSFENGGLPAEIAGKPVLKDIVDKADAAVAGNDKCADLRFGHDSGIGPVLALIKVEGYDKSPHLADSFDVWPAWKYLPMGSNLQLIFYHNRKGDVLVKILRNEEETTIPAVPPFYGPYYKWSDLRAYFISILGDFRNN